MNSTAVLTLVMCILFFAVLAAIGVWGRKSSNSVEGFVLGSRSVGPWLSAFAYGTSYFSAVIFVGYAGQFGWNFGIAATWIGLGNAFIGSLLSWSILGRRTRIMTQWLKVKTMPEFFGERFGSKGLKTAAAAITFIFLIPYTASLYNGLSRLFAMAFGGVDYSVCVLVMAALTCLYVALGGYMATALSDFLQGMIMLVGIVAIVAAVLADNGGLDEAMRSLALGPNGGWQYASFFGADPLSLLAVVILTSLGTWGLPQMIGKFYAIRNEDAVKKGTVISTVFAIIVAGGSYFMGGFGRLYDVDVASEGFDAVIPAMLSTLSPFLIAVIIILVLSASMSTLSSLVLTSSSALTLDLLVPAAKKEVSEKRKLDWMRLFIVVFVLISALIAIAQAKNRSVFIAQMMGISWGALAGSFLAPFLYGLYSKKTTKAAVTASFAYGVCVEIVQLLISLGIMGAPKSRILALVFRNSLYSGAFAMISGLVLVPLVSFLTKGQAPKDADRIFACYDIEKTAQIREYLGN